MKSPPRKVLRVIARLNVGGPAKHVTWVSSGLNSSGRWENTLMHGMVEENEDDYTSFTDAKRVKRLELGSLKRSIHPLRDLITVWQIFAWMLKNQPEILHTHTSKAGFTARAAALIYSILLPFRKLKVIHTFHGHTFHGYFSPAKEKLFLYIERFLARFATDRIITISKQQQLEIRDQYKVGRADKHCLLPLGIDLAFAKELDQSKLRGKFNLSPEVFVFGIVGRIAPIKDHALFIRACKEFEKLSPGRESAFLIIGGGSPEEVRELEILKNDLSLKNLHFTGNLEDPREIYGALNALVLTSKNEGTPVSILESFACKIPVVSTMVGGVRDLLGKSRGIAVERDARRIAEGMLEISQSDHTPMIEEAFEYVAQNYSKERLVQDLDNLYTSLLEPVSEKSPKVD